MTVMMELSFSFSLLRTIIGSYFLPKRDRFIWSLFWFELYHTAVFRSRSQGVAWGAVPLPAQQFYPPLPPITLNHGDIVCCCLLYVRDNRLTLSNANLMTFARGHSPGL